MPTDEDASMKVGIAALAPKRIHHRLKNKKDGADFNLILIKTCKIIVKLRLTQPDGRFDHYCIGWDGVVLWDHPHTMIVNNWSDRTSKSAANAIFDRIYPKCKFAKWLVIHAFAIYKAKAPD